MRVVRRLNTKESPSTRPTVILTQALRTGSSKKVRTSLDFFLSVVPRKRFEIARFKATLWPSRRLKWTPIIFNSLLLRLLSSEVSAFFQLVLWLSQGSPFSGCSVENREVRDRGQGAARDSPRSLTAPGVKTKTWRHTIAKESELLANISRFPFSFRYMFGVWYI